MEFSTDFVWGLFFGMVGTLIILTMIAGYAIVVVSGDAARREERMRDEQNSHL